MTLTYFLLFLAACAPSAATGVLFQPGDWYRSLAKPSWTPPNWVFPVVWTTLYLAMSWAAARIAIDAETQPLAAIGLAFWAIQIGFNILWTPVFFGLRKMRAGLVVIGVLWLSVAATLAVFVKLDILAGLLMVPYLLWVTIAFSLNAAVLRLNPRATA